MTRQYRNCYRVHRCVSKCLTKNNSLKIDIVENLFMSKRQKINVRINQAFTTPQ
jgi:hypothetical protein